MAESVESILVVYIEDNPANVVVVEPIVESLGYKLLVAPNATQGLEMIARECPNIILMDISLPDIDGLTATGMLRAREESKHIPIIAVTANAMAGDREKCLASGCNDYIAKPFQVKTLLTSIKHQ